MDGNRRWARQCKKTHETAYRAGMEAARRIIRHAAQSGIQVLTLYTFSSENWQRPRPQVQLLLSLMAEGLRTYADELREQGVRLRFIGEQGRFSSDLRAQMRVMEEQVPETITMTVCLAVHYGGRQDLLRAFERCSEHQTPLSEDAISAALDTADLPDPDLLIRTGGEQRLSNFLLWQLAYTELYFSDCLWPDFDEGAFDQALAWYAGRDRRFGVSSG